jgi:hypothetical protein
MLAMSSSRPGPLTADRHNATAIVLWPAADDLAIGLLSNRLADMVQRLSQDDAGRPGRCDPAGQVREADEADDNAKGSGAITPYCGVASPSTIAADGLRSR